MLGACLLHRPGLLHAELPTFPFPLSWILCDKTAKFFGGGQDQLHLSCPGEVETLRPQLSGVQAWMLGQGIQDVQSYSSAKLRSRVETGGTPCHAEGCQSRGIAVCTLLLPVIKELRETQGWSYSSSKAPISRNKPENMSWVCQALIFLYKHCSFLC